jgi:zinc protease
MTSAPVSRVRLDNGLTLLIEELRNAPVVALQAWIKVGAASEDDSISGIAHLHEHMLFKGTSKRGVGEIAKTVESSGGEINAWTSFDETVYHLVMAADEMQIGVDILADAVRNSTFDSEELRRETEVVVEEIRRDYDSPARRLSRAFFSTLYQQHPYRRPILGTQETVRSFTREKLLHFFHQHYRPDNAVVIAVGDFETPKMLEILKAHFADWRAPGDYKHAVRVAETPSTQLRTRILREDVKEARLMCGWQIPGLCHDDIAAIDVLSMILGHGEASRLNVEVRRRQDLVNDVYAYAYTPKDQGLLAAGAGIKLENLSGALQAILEQIWHCKTGLVTHDELERARITILSESAYQRETVQGQARKRGFFETAAGDFNFEDRYYEQLKTLTPESIRGVAQRYITDAPTIVIQGPEAQMTINDSDIASIVERVTSSHKKRPAKELGALGFTRLALSNGAVILVREEEHSPTVALRAVCLGGQRYEDKTTQGLAHLFGSVYGLATQDLDAEALARKVVSLGGGLHAFAGRSTLGMRAEFIREKAEEGLELFCDALLRPKFYPNDLERERGLTLEHIRNREDHPSSVASDLFFETLYPHHSYGLRFIGTETSVASFSMQDIEAYHRRFAAPDKWVVSVVGGIGRSHAVDFLAELLETGKSESLATTCPPDPAPEQPRKAHYTLKKEQSHVLVGSMGVRVTDPERHSLDVLTAILSGQSGRLFLDLRDIRSLAYSVSSSSVDGVDPGYVLVHMASAPHKLQEALSGIYEHLQALRDVRVSEEELQRAKRYLIGSHAIELQRAGARAMAAAVSERLGLGFDAYSRYPELIGAVTAEKVQQAAKKYLRSERLVEVVVGPA